MKYQLHDADKELWSWVKARAYMAGLSINDYILGILSVEKHTADMLFADEHKYDNTTLRPLKP